MFSDRIKDFDDPVSFLQSDYYINETVLLFSYQEENYLKKGIYDFSTNCLYTEKNIKKCLNYDIVDYAKIVGVNNNENTFILILDCENWAYLIEGRPLWKSELIRDKTSLDILSKFNELDNPLLIELKYNSTIEYPQDG